MLTRRGFCSLVGGCAVGACTASDGGVVQIGPIGGGGDDTSGPDANPNIPPDARVQSPPDASTSATCGTGAIDVGLPSSYTLNTPKLFSSSNFWVVKDAGGFYALNSRCTHENAQTEVLQGEFYCPRHGAEFTFNGAIIGGPVNRPLVHYPMCVLSNGHLAVDKSTTTSASDRLNP